MKKITESIKFVDVNALLYAKKNVKNAFTIVPFCFLSSSTFIEFSLSGFETKFFLVHQRNKNINKTGFLLSGCGIGLCV